MKAFNFWLEGKGKEKQRVRSLRGSSIGADVRGPPPFVLNSLICLPPFSSLLRSPPVFTFISFFLFFCL